MTNFCNPWAAILLKLDISLNIYARVTGVDVSETHYILTELKCYCQNVNTCNTEHIHIMKHSYGGRFRI